MAEFNDKIKLSVNIECGADDRAMIAEQIEEAVFTTISQLDKDYVLGTEVRVVG